MIETNNLFSGFPVNPPDELTTVLIQSEAVRIERIVSRGHASPDGFWYDQPQDEWVVVLQGTATLRFEDDDQPLELQPGDFVNIPASRRHRVEWTSPDTPVVWLAVFYQASR